MGAEFCAMIVYFSSLNRERERALHRSPLPGLQLLSLFLLPSHRECLYATTVPKRERERGGGLTNPFVNPERDVGLEVMLDLIYEAFFGMEPRVDFPWWMFTG